MKTIKLYGDLAKFIGKKTFRVNVETVGEAIRFLVANFPQIEAHMSEREYRVKTGKHILDETEIHYPVGSSETISIIPVIAGAGAVGRIIAGVFLIAASFLIAGAFLFNVALAPIVFSVGVSLVLGGVAQLLAPTPGTSEMEKDPRQSYSFSGIQNSSRSGLPLPVVYGEIVVGSVTVSMGLTTEAI